MTTTLPLSVPVVMCLAQQNGVGRRVPITETKSHIGSMFCETCAARQPCYAHHVVKPKQP